MRAIILLAVILVSGAGRTSIAQVDDAATRRIPPIVVNLPDNVASETLTIRYLLFAADGWSVGRNVSPQRSVRQYVIKTALQILHAKIVAYAPGCQTMRWELDLDGHDANEQFVCNALPTKRIRGFLAPSEIPASLVPRDARLDIPAELEANWICDFFMRGSGATTQGIAGSCLVPSIKLGKVGVLDPADNGFFELTIPDFTNDPSYQAGFAAPASNYGSMIITLQDRTIGRTLTSIFPSADSEPGLEVKRDYTDPLVFTIWRPGDRADGNRPKP